MTGRAGVVDFYKYFLNWRWIIIISTELPHQQQQSDCPGQACNLPSELQDRLGGGGDVAVRPGQEVELSHRPRLARLAVLQVERPHQVILAPHVLRHQVDLQQQQQQH